MKARRAGLLMRMRARWIAEYDELTNLLRQGDSISHERVNQLIKLKGRIAAVEERLRQNGYSWEVDHEPK